MSRFVAGWWIIFSAVIATGFWIGASQILRLVM